MLGTEESEVNESARCLRADEERMVEVVFPPVTRRGGNKKKSEMNGCLPIGLSGPTSHQPIRRPGEGWYWPRRCPPSSAAARHHLPAGEGGRRPGEGLD